MKEDTIETNGGMVDVEESRILLHHYHKNAILVTTRNVMSIRTWSIMDNWLQRRNINASDVVRMFTVPFSPATAWRWLTSSTFE
jgi:hypothetical protein